MAKKEIKAVEGNSVKSNVKGKITIAVQKRSFE